MVTIYDANSPYIFGHPPKKSMTCIGFATSFADRIELGGTILLNYLLI